MNGIDTRADDYLRRVKAALADLPADEVAEVMEDLEAHVAEVFAEAGSAEEVERRLGTPEEYAAELRAAGGYPTGNTPSGERARVWLGRLVVWAAVAATALAGLAGVLAMDRYQEEYLGLALVGGLIALPAAWLVFAGTVRRSDVEAVPEYRWGREKGLRLVAATPWAERVRGMRGAWRLVRLVVLALAFLGALGADGGFWMVAILAAAVVLVWLGPRVDTDRRLLLLVVPANALVVGLGIALAASAVQPEHDSGGYYYPVSNPEGFAYYGNTVENVYAVDKDGKPISDFYLYDQHGNPLSTPRYGCLDGYGDREVSNRYPAPVAEHGPNGCVERPAPTFVPLPPGLIDPPATPAPTTTAPTTSPSATTAPTTTAAPTTTK
ncbi:DUF1700 domain-containing protein [Actinokineospora guangxiensis]|uniref:DUF1700 domain-containing protein n=1 Tax=Actinokineospora guangxiensis TaxID=1490288 RepID=A0ABW0ESY7_9PSEU